MVTTQRGAINSKPEQNNQQNERKNPQHQAAPCSKKGVLVATIHCKAQAPFQ